MDISYLLGLTLDEGIEIIKKNYDCKVNIIKTYGQSKKIKTELDEPRIIRISFDNDEISLVIGYF